ncbi:hypothetical protein LOAG_10070 [Loa loa]|uniref:Uncharacterized protein n=1 Tax=Loa loa TaxID=7209 RepID=A0A1S0TQI5_LOALO|nr:hypothetical protein LOAG_10070 [Loa loa]EFO18426.1 hypothetical protein LOAG_10070 [Loa loa]
MRFKKFCKLDESFEDEEQAYTSIITKHKLTHEAKLIPKDNSKNATIRQISETPILRIEERKNILLLSVGFGVITLYLYRKEFGCLILVTIELDPTDLMQPDHDPAVHHYTFTYVSFITELLSCLFAIHFKICLVENGRKENLLSEIYFKAN